MSFVLEGKKGLVLWVSLPASVPYPGWKEMDRETETRGRKISQVKVLELSNWHTKSVDPVKCSSQKLSPSSVPMIHRDCAKPVSSLPGKSHRSALSRVALLP